jgi:hypothetical protein
MRRYNVAQADFFPSAVKISGNFSLFRKFGGLGRFCNTPARGLPVLYCSAMTSYFPDMPVRLISAAPAPG